ncbi:MAG TPA: hypothetical protein VKT78_04265 [Fimbriimonadaceae bacterium]|nr:hypothetical protein [Fimbriimonadaceae bacterium]
MKTRMIALAAVATTLIGGGALVASNSFAQATPPPVTGGKGGQRHAERHPEIRKAMRQLSAALKTMHDAADDFKGHKEAAVDDTQKALDQLKQALAADRN